MSCPSCHRPIVLAPIYCAVHQRPECAICAEHHQRDLEADDG